MNCMTGDDQADSSTLRDVVKDARREAAAALARLAEAAVRYADNRTAEDTAAASGLGSGRLKRAKPGEFVADELALMLRDQPYQVRCLLARSRRMAADLPTDLRTPLRTGASEEEIAALWVAAVAGKQPGHGINDPSFLQPDRPMSAIGG
jgi:hypothetical protein